MAQEGFEIYGRFYPSPERFRMGDPVLIKDVTGMSWPEFVGALNAQSEEAESLREQGREDEFQPDQVLLLGLMAVAFWHGNRQMSRYKVAQAVERMPIEEVQFVPGDEEEVDAVPPAETGADGSMPSTTSSESAVSPEASATTEIPAGSILDETSPNGSGSPGSPSQLPESLQA